MSKGRFFKIMGFAGKRFLFSPPLPLQAASSSVALAPIFAQPKSEKRLQRTESPTETLATQAIIGIDILRGVKMWESEGFVNVGSISRFCACDLL